MDKEKRERFRIKEGDTVDVHWNDGQRPWTDVIVLHRARGSGDIWEFLDDEETVLGLNVNGETFEQMVKQSENPPAPF